MQKARTGNRWLAMGTLTDPECSHQMKRLADLAVEGLVIVLCILLAFWIDAMRELSRERAQAARVPPSRAE